MDSSSSSVLFTFVLFWFFWFFLNIFCIFFQWFILPPWIVCFSFSCFISQSSTCSIISSSFLQIGHIVSLSFLFYIPHVESNWIYLLYHLCLPFHIYSFISHLSFCIVLASVFYFKSSVRLCCSFFFILVFTSLFYVDFSIFQLNPA